MVGGMPTCGQPGGCRARWVVSILCPVARPRGSEGSMADLPTTRVVIDCDTGVDDTMAVFYGLLASHIDVVGLSCVWGNIGVDLTTMNTLRLLEMMDRPDIPVARGAHKPLLGPQWPLGHGVHGS